MSNRPWKVLIVDDEEDVHRITRLVLKGLTFEGRPIQLLSAYSKAEAIEILKEHPDVALAIIDVVMEDKHAGLDLVRYIREELKNRKVRLVIRTGQPGYAPQREVVINYDINDYREKDELSSANLITVILSGLRSYRDILLLEAETRALKRTVGFVSELSGHIKRKPLRELVYSAAKTIEEIASEHTDSVKVEVLEDCPEHLEEGSFVFWESSKSVYACVRSGDDWYAIHLFSDDPIEGSLRDIIDIFLHSFVNAADKALASVELNQTLQEIVEILSEALETRSEETGMHVFRVASIVYDMAAELGIDEETRYQWKLGAMLHDIGKIGIPDSILNKPGKLTPEEFEVIKRHTVIGHKILSRSNKPLFQTAARIALYHHENWDGTGYPYGLKGEEIPLEARLTAIADVYDALTSDRVYRRAWSREEALKFIKENAGAKFDPDLVDIFLRIV